MTSMKKTRPNIFSPNPREVGLYFWRREREKEREREREMKRPKLTPPFRYYMVIYPNPYIIIIPKLASAPRVDLVFPRLSSVFP